MIAAWMIYAIFVATLVALAAHAAERALRMTARPARWAWAAAVLLSCILPLTSRVTAPARTARMAAGSTGGLGLPRRPLTSSTPAGVLGAIPGTIRIPRMSTLAALDRPLRAFWFAGSAAWLLVLAASMLSVARSAAEWTPAVVDGIPVRVSHSVGPALIGLLAPDVVLPVWALELPRTQRMLAIEHERQHAIARDPLLLLGAAVALAAMPWNVALWYTYRRLRLAVEADCDQRVLRVRPGVHAYGSLLIEVSERTLPGAMPVVALAEPASHLARRIELMTLRPSSHITRQLATAVLASMVSTALACRTPHPIAAAPIPDSQFAGHAATLGENFSSAPTSDSIFDATARHAVAERYPQALRGEMGTHAAIWIVADARDSVLGSATGHEGFSRGPIIDSVPEQGEWIEWESGMRMFPGVVPPISPGAFVQWKMLAVGRDTVNVIWFRVSR